MKSNIPKLLQSEQGAQALIDQLVAHRFDGRDAGVHPFWFLLERIGVAICLVVLAIPLALVYLLVRTTSRGPGIFSQVRVGKHGRIFTIYKFRTMYVDAETRSGPVWSAGNEDPRTTQVGRILRKLHIDELPQLWNVVRGEMRLIGPRPERPAFVLMLAGEVDGYLDRLAVRPGIAGLAQVYLPPDETIGCVRRKVIFDNFYISHRNLWLDLQILCCALFYLFGIQYGRATRWFGLNRRCIKAGLMKPGQCSFLDPEPGPVRVANGRKNIGVAVPALNSSGFDVTDHTCSPSTSPARRKAK